MTIAVIAAGKANVKNIGVYLKQYDTIISSGLNRMEMRALEYASDHNKHFELFIGIDGYAKRKTICQCDKNMIDNADMIIIFSNGNFLRGRLVKKYADTIGKPCEVVLRPFNLENKT